MRKYRIKKSAAFENGHVFPCYFVQMRILGFIWITVKEYIEEYPGGLGYHCSAKGEAEDLLDRLNNPY